MKKVITALAIILCINICQANDLTEQAKVLYASNNLKDAFTILLSIPEEERTADNWLLIGNILQDEGKTDDAIFMYNHAISVNEKDYKAHYNLGNIYLEQNKPNLAINEYKKAIKYNPEFAYGYYNLGCAYLATGKIKTAKWQFFKAIDINNQVADFHYNLAYTFKQLNNEKQARTYLEYYNKLIEREQ